MATSPNAPMTSPTRRDITAENALPYIPPGSGRDSSTEPVRSRTESSKQEWDRDSELSQTSKAVIATVFGLALLVAAFGDRTPRWVGGGLRDGSGVSGVLFVDVDRWAGVLVGRRHTHRRIQEKVEHGR